MCDGATLGIPQSWAGDSYLQEEPGAGREVSRQLPPPPPDPRQSGEAGTALQAGDQTVLQWSPQCSSGRQSLTLHPRALRGGERGRLEGQLDTQARYWGPRWDLPSRAQCDTQTFCLSPSSLRFPGEDVWLARWIQGLGSSGLASRSGGLRADSSLQGSPHSGRPAWARCRA